MSYFPAGYFPAIYFPAGYFPGSGVVIPIDPTRPVVFGWRAAARRVGPSPAFTSARRVSATRKES